MRNILRKQLPLISVLALVTILLSSCFIPEKFIATLNVTKDYGYTFEYDGLIAFGPALGEIAKNGSLPHKTDNDLRQGTANTFKKEDGFDRASYQGKGRWKVHFKKKGTVGTTTTIFTDIVTLRRGADGSVSIEGITIDAEVAQQLKAVNFVIDGKLEITTDMTVVSHNATEAPKLLGLIGSYGWKISSKNLTSPVMILKGADTNAKSSAGQEEKRKRAEEENAKMPLIEAVEKGNTKLVKMLLAKGADVNKKNESGTTALFSAVNYGNTEIVKLLLDKGADVNEKYKYGSTPLIWAVRNENPEIVKMLLEKGADVRIKDTTGKTVFDYINDFNIQEPKILEMLKYTAPKKDKGADAKTKGNDGQMDLLSAVEKGNSKMVKELLDKGVDVNARDDRGDFTALISAVENGNTEIVKMLIAKGADVNAKDNYNGTTVLINATNKGNIEIVKMLLAKGADVNRGGSGNQTALFEAADKGHIEIVKMLLDKGADVNTRDFSGGGQTPLMYAARARKGHTEIVKMLLAKGADVNDAKNKNGITALIIAIATAEGNEHNETIKLLLEKGADVSIKDNRGKTAFDYTQNPKILEMLNKYAAQKKK